MKIGDDFHIHLCMSFGNWNHEYKMLKFAIMLSYAKNGVKII